MPSQPMCQQLPDLPMVGFGTYLIPDDQAADCVKTAFDVGYRHMDTAEVYRNERGVGEGIQAAMDDLSLDRDDFFVTTKVFPGGGHYGMPIRGKAEIKQTLQESLDRLALDHVDLYLIHAPFAGERRAEQWQALVELRDDGLTRHIGVSNFSVDHIQKLLDAGLPKPEANQIELHPWSQRPELTSYLFDQGIAPIAYSSLVPLANWREGQRSAKPDAMRADGADAPFKAMADKYGVTEAQVLLRWGVQKGYPVLPKSVHPDRIHSNFDLFGFEIDAEDMAAVEAMDHGPGVAWKAGDPVATP